MAEISEGSNGHGQRRNFRIHPRVQILSMARLLHWEEDFLGGWQCKRHHPRLRGIHRGIKHVITASSQRAEARPRDRSHGCETGRMMTSPLRVSFTPIEGPGEHNQTVCPGGSRPRWGVWVLGEESSQGWEYGLKPMMPWKAAHHCH